MRSDPVPAGSAVARARRLLLRPGVKQFVSSGIGGAAATVVDLGALVALVETGTPIAVAAFVATTLGAAFHFAWCKYLAFGDRSPLAVGQMLRFAAVGLANALLIALAMQLVAVELGVPYVVAKLVCSTLVFAVWTYPAQRYLVFRAGARRALGLRAQSPRAEAEPAATRAAG